MPLPRRVAAATLLVLPALAACAPSTAQSAAVDSAAAATAEPAAADAATWAPAFGDARLATGVRLRYAEHGDPTGAPVILLHGYSDTWYSFSRVLPLLGPDVRAFALDQRGHGDSDRPRSGYAVGDLAADVLAFMDARGLTRATIVGHSMGSLVAQQVALRAPERVAGLVLVGAPSEGRRIVGLGDLAGELATMSDPVPLAFTRAFQESTIHGAVPAAFVTRVSEDSRKLPLHAWRALMDGMLATRPATGLGEARIPTLLLWGERDAYVLRGEQEALLAMIPGATLVPYAETGHAPHWERPEAFARELMEFVRTKARS